LFDVGDFLAASFVGFIELLDSGPEKVVGILVVSREQSSFRLCVGLKVPIRMDMENIGEFLGVAANQDGPVTVQGIFLGAHQSDAAFADSHFETFQAFLKQRRLSNPVVIRPVADVAITFVAASTQFLAEEYVANAVFLEFLLQRWSAEPRQTAEWPGPNVGHDLDAVLLQQRDKLGKFVGRVTDGEERVHSSKIVAAILY